MLTIFAIVNVGLVAVAVISDLVSTALAPLPPLMCMWAVEFVKSVAMVEFMDYGARRKPRIGASQRLAQVTPSIFLSFTASTTFVKTLLCVERPPTQSLSQSLFFPTSWATLPQAWLYFVVKSFVFELIFDFVHYWIHRYAHANKVLYRSVHKTHHSYQVCARASFCMSPADVVLSYCVPYGVANLFLRLSKAEAAVMATYLTYQEIGGHLNRRMKPTSSFAQCVWLPRWFNIELYTEDHDRHHSRNAGNYSKRFSLWDKIFGTQCQSGK